MTIHVAEQPLSMPVLLAPMAGITDLPFRRLVAGFGAGLVVSEMIASGELVKSRGGTRARALTDGQAGTAVQIAGRDPALMAEAARMAEAMGARIIDINMGCPAKKVTGGLSGSALMRDPDLALRLVAAVVGAVRVPVTLKTRLGWDDDCRNAPALARRARDAGVAMVTIHGRTRCQFYKGRADWAAIRPVVAALDIPVVANGDVTCPETARAALVQSRAAGVMVGRGAQGAPWVPAEIAAAIYGTPAPVVPSGDALVDFVAGHHDAMLSFYGRDLGLRVARKHLGWYMDRADTPAALRRAVLMAPDPATVRAHLPGALAPDHASASANGRCAA